MSKLKRPALKTYFERGDIPTQGQFYDFIDSSRYRSFQEFHMEKISFVVVPVMLVPSSVGVT